MIAKSVTSALICLGLGICLLLPAGQTARAETPADAAHIEATLKQNLYHAPGLGLAGRQARASDYDWDVLDADILFWPNFGAQTLSGSVEFLSEAKIAPLAEIVVDFKDNMSVDALTINGSPMLFDHSGDEITITITPPIPFEQQFTLIIAYSGSPESGGFGSYTWTDHDGTDLVTTLSEMIGARDWWPCKDIPDDKFTANVRYRVPSEFSAPGPGLLQAVTSNGDGTNTWHWRTDYPISTYLIAMSVTNYDHYTDWYYPAVGDPIPIENYVYPENYANSVEDLGVTPEVLGVLDSVFGAYPFADEKYGHAVFHWGGAMEHQTCTSYGDALLSGEHYYDRIVVHEAAHQWWGDAVTLVDWENVWLNEGFASYSEAIWFEYTDGQQGLTDWMTNTTADPVYDGPVYNNESPFSYTVYRKGAWVLHMLRFLLDDDDQFYAALRYYLDEHYFENAHTTELQADLEAYLGLDLETFFQQWVYGLYRPVYEWGWQTIGEPGNWSIDLVLRQVQTNTGLFETPIPLRVTTTAGTVDIRVDNAHWAQRFIIPVGADEPTGVEFDPDNWILENHSAVPFDPTAVGDPVPVRATAIAGNWPNPFNPKTRVNYSLEAAGETHLDIFSIDGRLVRKLVDGHRAAGNHDLLWDGLDQRGRALPSGVYLAQLRAAGKTTTHRMTPLK